MLAVCQQQTDLATEKVCCGQIAFLEEGFDNWGMVKRPKKARKYDVPRKPTKARPAGREPGPTEILHLGLWIAALDREQSEVAKQAGYGKAYINNLINPKKGEKAKQPRALAMLRISRALGVTVNDLYRLPPPRAGAERMREYGPETRRSLMDAGN